MAAGDVSISAGNSGAPKNHKGEQEQNTQLAGARIAAARRQAPHKKNRDTNDPEQKHDLADVHLAKNIAKNVRSIFSKETENIRKAPMKIKPIIGARPLRNDALELGYVRHIEKPINRDGARLSDNPGANNLSRERGAGERCQRVHT